MYLFSLKLVDKGLMKDTRIQRGEKGDGCSRQSGQQHPPRDAGTRPGGGHPLFRPFSRLIALSLLRPAYQISCWSVFDIKLLCEPVWNTLPCWPPVVRTSRECLSKHPETTYAKLSPACVQSALCCSSRRGIDDLYLVEYLDCRRFVWCIIL